MSKHVENADPTEGMTEAEMAEYYYKTRDLSGFDFDHPEPVTIRRNVTISVRFSEEEIKALRARAEEAGVKVTSYIRAAALEAGDPVDRAALSRLAQELERRAHDVAEMVKRGVA